MNICFLIASIMIKNQEHNFSLFKDLKFNSIFIILSNEKIALSIEGQKKEFEISLIKDVFIRKKKNSFNFFVVVGLVIIIYCFFNTKSYDLKVFEILIGFGLILLLLFYKRYSYYFYIIFFSGKRKKYYFQAKYKEDVKEAIIILKEKIRNR